MGSDVAGEKAKSEVVWRRRVIFLRTVVLVGLWVGVVIVTLKFADEYTDRRKETVALEAVDVNSLDPPSLYIDTETDTDCVYVLNTCAYTNSSSHIDCSSAVTKGTGHTGDSAHIMDSRTLLSLGVRFKTPTDLLRLVFVLVFASNNTRADIKSCTSIKAKLSEADDSETLVPGRWQTVILLSDIAIVDAFLNNTAYDPKRMGSLSFVGYGQSAHYSFSLEQEFFIKSPPKNTTAFGMSQYPYVNKNALQLLLSPSTFTVRKIQHNKGQSLFELMGGIFGWFGILVGASIYSMFNNVVDLVERARKKAQSAEEENDKDHEPTQYVAPSFRVAPTAENIKIETI
eukprot:TRINITY_DN1447_c0_g1_i1.p1 TRINITY_DN1447_c0_g1~~TRINITY_DN1447_c0_g1_i1.p1  ORF type:complete len:343 (+),score=69.28 TRINITY_DN1447_c0_g1_i1:40-1068(+)